MPNESKQISLVAYPRKKKLDLTLAGIGCFQLFEDTFSTSATKNGNSFYKFLFDDGTVLVAPSVWIRLELTGLRKS